MAAAVVVLVVEAEEAVGVMLVVQMNMLTHLCQHKVRECVVGSYLPNPHATCHKWYYVSQTPSPTSHINHPPSHASALAPSTTTTTTTKTATTTTLPQGPPLHPQRSHRFRARQQRVQPPRPPSLPRRLRPCPRLPPPSRRRPLPRSHPPWRHRRPPRSPPQHRPLLRADHPPLVSGMDGWVRWWVVTPRQIHS